MVLEVFLIVATHCCNFEVHVFFAADDKVALPARVCIVSLLSTSTEKERFHFHFVGEGFNEKNTKKLLLLKNKFRPFSVEWIPFDLSRLNGYHTRRWNKKILLKLFVTEIFPHLDRVLWLDCDVVVLKNIGNLYKTDLNGKYFAANDLCLISRQKGNEGMYWFHGGIQLFNLVLMRKDNLQETLLASARNVRRGCKERACFGGIDEYALSTIEFKRTIPLPQGYNVLTAGNKMGYNPSLRLNVSDIVVIHFLNRLKPWKHPRKYFDPLYFGVYEKFMQITERACRLQEKVVFPLNRKVRKKNMKTRGKSGSRKMTVKWRRK